MPNTYVNLPYGIGPTQLPLGGGQGAIYFVDPLNGNDGNSGLTVEYALKTITQAYAKCVGNANEVIYYLADSGSISLTAELVWSKNYTHLIGVVAPSQVAQRARVFAASTVTASPLIDVQGTGCVFKNLYFFYGVASASALVNVRVSGSRNYFENVHFAGIGDATQDATDAASLQLYGAQENVFKHCAIGLDTVARGANSTELKFTIGSGAVTRNLFEDCLIYAYISDTAHTLLAVDTANAVDRWNWFRRCTFLSESLNNATPMASAFSLPASLVTSYFLLDTCVGVDITVWDSNSRGKTYIFNAPTPAATTAGLSTVL